MFWQRPTSVASRGHINNEILLLRTLLFVEESLSLFSAAAPLAARLFCVLDLRLSARELRVIFLSLGKATRLTIARHL